MRQLYYSDNLPILRTMPDDFVDLIYLDPPFNSNKTYNIIYPGDLGQVTAFEDTWYWTPECDVHVKEIEAQPGEIGQLLPALVKGMGKKVQMSAYLVNMSLRLIELQRVLKPTGSLYLHCDPTAGHYLKVVLDAIFGRGNFQNEIVWCYRQGGRSDKRFARKHDLIFWYSKGKEWTFNAGEIRVPYEGTGGFQTSGKGVTRKDTGKTYLPNPDGKIPEDWWDIPALPPLSKERLGYPTQKPLDLLDRIVQASSNPGDIVLDPFCGCGTAIEAAEKGNRQWIGIDITYSAISAIQERFRRNRRDVWKEVEIKGAPETVEEIDTTLLNQSSPLYARKEFEKFCVASIGGMPNNKMGADGGVDGKIPLEEGKIALVSVKSGHVGVAQLRELKGVLDAKNVAGVFITRRPPTRPMIEFANQAGIVQIDRQVKGLLPPHSCPVLQVVTLEDILAGKHIRLPMVSRKI